MPNQPIGAQIQQLRIEAGLTQAQLAERYAAKNNGRGTPSYIADIEQDRRESPNIKTLQILTGILGYEMRVFGEEISFVKRDKCDDLEAFAEWLQYHGKNQLPEDQVKSFLKEQ